jgi:hypothetical protein
MKRKRSDGEPPADAQRMGAHIDVHIETVSGAPFTVSVGANGTILDAKKAIRAEKGFSIGRLCLLKAGDEDQRSNNDRLCDLGFDGSSRIELTLLLGVNLEVRTLCAFREHTDKELWQGLHEDLEIEDVGRLSLQGITIVSFVVGLDVCRSALKGTSNADCHIARAIKLADVVQARQPGFGKCMF